jgi:ribosomal protein S18 acetylase RimI-like enzyme
VGKFLYRRLLLLERSLVQPTADIAVTCAPLDILPLERREIAEYLSFYPGESCAQIESRLDRGDVCFLARCEGRIVGALWTTRGSQFVRYFRTELAVASDEGYFYDVYTAPACRGRGVAPALYFHACHHYRERGIRRVTAAVVPENRASIRSFTKTGFGVVARVGYVQVGPWRRPFRTPASDDGH